MCMQFYLANAALAIYEDAYLVKVDTHKNDLHPADRLTDLPDWVFHSRNAIWLTEEDAPLSIRAQHGELIKSRLSEELNSLKISQH
jgi:adenylate kinase